VITTCMHCTALHGTALHGTACVGRSKAADLVRDGVAYVV
jgi:hypothetical protein